MPPPPATLAAILWVLAVVIACPCFAKPTREQIVSLADDCEKQEKRLDLIVAFGTDFSGLDLSGVNFRGYHRVGFETNLGGVNFAGSNLQQAQFGAAVLDGADFTGADLRDAVFITASLKDVTLRQANVKGARLYQSHLARAKLPGLDLSAADITGSDFAGADLSGARLSGAKNEYAWSDFTQANLEGANLSGLRLHGVSFRDANLRSADLTGAQLMEADFSGADLTGTLLQNANLESAVFKNVTGLSRDQLDAYESQAQRWKYDLREGAANLLENLYFPTYAVLAAGCLVLACLMLVPSRRTRSTTTMAVINLAAVLPALFLFRMHMAGGSSTVQFNAGDRGALEWWSAWVSLFGPALLLLLGGLITSGVLFLVFLARNWRWRAMREQKLAGVYLILTITHCLFATHWVASNAPTA